MNDIDLLVNFSVKLTRKTKGCLLIPEKTRLVQIRMY